MPLTDVQVEVQNEGSPLLAEGAWWNEIVAPTEDSVSAITQVSTQPAAAPALLERLGSRLPKTPFLARIELQAAQGDRFTIYADFALIMPGSATAIWSNRGEATFADIRLTVKRREQSFEFSTRPNRRPANAHEFYLALRFQRVISQKGTLTIEDRETGIVLFQGDWPAGLAAPPDPNWLSVLADLDTIQRRVCRPIPITEGQQIGPEEMQTISKLRTILHEGGFSGTWINHTVIVPLSVARNWLSEALSTEQGRFLRTEGLVTEVLFGQELPFQRTRLSFAQARIADATAVREQVAHASAEDAPIEIRLVPGEDRTFRAEYLDWALHRAIERIGGAEVNQAAQAPEEVASTPGDLEEEMFALWSRLPAAERRRWFQALDALVPSDSPLLEMLEDFEAARFADAARAVWAEEGGTTVPLEQMLSEAGYKRP